MVFSRSCFLYSSKLYSCSSTRNFQNAAALREKSSGATASEHVSPRAAGLGHAIEDEYAAIRENYSTLLRFLLVPKHTLMGP